MFGFLADKIGGLFSSFGGKKTVSQAELDQALTQVQDLLLNADVPFKIAKKLAENLRGDLARVDQDSKVKFQDRFHSLLYNRLVELMGGEDLSEKMAKFSFKPGSTVLVAGLQGAGKTTTISKLATFVKSENKNIKIATTSLDFVRPAAIDQLEILSKKVGIDFIVPERDSISGTLSRVKSVMDNKQYDLVFVDTPGRSQINSELMVELREILSLVTPQYTLLVIDSMTGQESLNVAKAFDEVMDIYGAVLTKADSDSKGGVSLSLFSELQKPVLFLGTGEKPEEMERFVPKRIASRIMGMGDFETFAEKIDKQVARENRQNDPKVGERFMKGEFNLQDFLEQMEMMSSLGPLQKLVGYIPGLSGISAAQVEQTSQMVKKLKSMIYSMTEKERLFPQVLDRSRKARVARGSGVLEAEVTELLKKFEESKRFAKMLGEGKWKERF